MVWYANEGELLELLNELRSAGCFDDDEYAMLLSELKGDPPYNGALSVEQKRFLKDRKFKEKQIEQIETMLQRYKQNLSSYADIVGDQKVPGNMFFLNMKCFGYLLKDNPEQVISPNGVLLRKKVTYPLVQKLGPLFLHSNLVLENRNELLGKIDSATGKYEQDRGIDLPNEPVIWAPNHHFKDDVLASVISTKRPAYILFGSVPQFYNTFDGVLAYLVGALMTNRKLRSSRRASIEKAKKAMSYNTDILLFPEGVWNKYPHHLLLKFWPGIYMLAKETGAKVAPIVHYIYDPTQRLPKHLNPIHTVVDDPIDIAQLSEKAALEYVRDVMSTWYYLMMEKYGKSTREEVLMGLPFKDAYDKYMAAMMDTVDRYDSEIERSAHFRPRNIIQPEDAFGTVAKVENITPDNARDVVFARELVRTRNCENFQIRY